jgi:Na+/proline symporter
LFDRALGRVLTVFLAILGTSLALYMGLAHRSSTLDLYIKIVGLLGGGLAGLFVAGIFTRRTNGRGVVVGFFVSAIVLYFVQTSGAVSFYLFSGIGIVTCVLVGRPASLVLPGADKNLSNLTIHTMSPVARS